MEYYRYQEESEARTREMKRTPIRRMSLKMAIQKVKEAKLKAELLIRCNGCCEYCGRYFGKALQKHEVKTRGQCGDPLDPKNCKMACPDCHEAQRGVKVIHAEPQWSKGRLPQSQAWYQGEVERWQ